MKKIGLGGWISGNDNDEKIIHFPQVRYSITILKFIQDVYTFVKEHEDLDLYQYKSILDYNEQSFKDANILALGG